MATLIPNFELAETIGSETVEIDAATVEELVRIGEQRWGEPFRAAADKAAIVVNGRAVSLLRGGKTPLGPADSVWLLLPSGGG